MRRYPFFLLLLASCGPDQSLVYDLDPIQLARAPIVPGGEATGGLLANVTTSAGIQPLLVDSAYPLASLAPAGCVGGGTPGWTYTGNIDLRDGSAAAPVRASFANVGLFDLCPGPTGDAATQPAGVMGGPLLANFSVGFVFPRSAVPPATATMTLWPAFPGSDDQLAQNGFVPLRFSLRGAAAAGQGTGEASLSLPNSRVVMSVCAAPRSFSTTEAVETCASGEAALKASGQDLTLAIGTGEGPLILSQSAWNRIAAELGVASDAGTVGDLYTPFSTTPTPARFLTLPRLAIFQGITDSGWSGPCTELARARRIEWVLANQGAGACFQPCDASGSQALTSHSYLELGGPLDLAVISETSPVIRSLNVDTPPNPQIDGIIGAGTLAGTRMRLDYPSTPEGRVIAACEDGSTRDQCWPAPSCPAWTANGQQHVCFGQLYGQLPRGWATACP
jgi:hypothetical protein